MGGIYAAHMNISLSEATTSLFILIQTENSPFLINSIECTRFALYQISIPPESLPWVTPFSFWVSGTTSVNVSSTPSLLQNKYICIS